MSSSESFALTSRTKPTFPCCARKLSLACSPHVYVAAPMVPVSWAKQTVRRYLVCTPYSLDIISFVVFSILSTSMQFSAICSRLSTSLKNASSTSSFRSLFVPGSSQPAFAAPPVSLPSCAKMRPSSRSSWMATTATIRRALPLLSMMTVEVPSTTSSRSLSVLPPVFLPWIDCLMEWRGTSLSFRSRSKCSRACKPMYLVAAQDIDETNSSNCVKGTLRSSGQCANGGCAHVTRLWYCCANSAAKRLSWLWDCTACTKGSGVTRSTLHPVLASAVPTWSQWHHSVLSDSHALRCTNSSVLSSTAEDSGLCEYFKVPPRRM
mmetsp:Transcript_127205/g.321410  ORF Transcript_127205/g.321410 Transcript_127205/m.321410 type:complete len:321 (-) Transcript_127205:672-1634(-)